jgi:hypothetical protein
MKKAAVTATALAVGGTVLNKSIVPESSASSASCTGIYVKCNFVAWDCVIVDAKDQFEGGLLGSMCCYCCNIFTYCCTLGGCVKMPRHVLSFGTANCKKGNVYPMSGEAIGSNRVLPDYTYHGLSFFTCFTQRMIITNDGNVGINAAPCSRLSVRAQSVTSTCTFITNAITGIAKCGYGVKGTSTTGTGVYGTSTGRTCCPTGGSGGPGGPGVWGHSCCGTGVKGVGKALGVTGQSCFPSGIGLQGLAGVPGAIPIVAKGASGQSANLMQFENNSGSALSIVNSKGWLGIGATSASTTLHIGGGISAKAVSPTSAYTMDTGGQDFAVLASASSAAFTVTLPAAATATGRIVFIKKTDSSINAVTIAAASGDNIEGKATQILTNQYDSLQLISNGSHIWFVLGNSIGKAFVS